MLLSAPQLQLHDSDSLLKGPSGVIETEENASGVIYSCW